MSQKDSREKESRWKRSISSGRQLLLPLLIVASITGALLVRGRIDPTSANLSERQERTIPAVGSASSLNLSRISSALLTDSILSIVQTYYVDGNRVTHAGLVDLTIRSLRSGLPGFTTGVDAGQRWVSWKGIRQNLNVADDMPYEAAVDQLTDLAALIDTGYADSAASSAVSNPADSLSRAQDPDERDGTAVVLNALLNALDAHSALLSAEAYQELRQGTEGAFGGLGVLVGMRDSLLTVIRPLPRSPALRAGIRKSDKILSINGTETFGSSLDELVGFMRGDPGTDVNISLLRDGAIAPEIIALKREVIHVDSVSVRESPVGHSGVLHLHIENFSTRTSREVLAAIKKTRRRNGGALDGLILDLRSNPGGLLDQAVQVADLFLEDGVIVSTRGRREEVERAGPGYDEIDFPVVVLINGDSASASEIVAGALQDHGRGVVIGQPSFGKGSVQTIFELPENRALKLTIARYYTPGDRSIQNVGIIPDIWIQPLLKSDTNANLLGEARYKNERFLRNHLTGDEDKLAVSGSSPRSAIKGYYLEESSDESTNAQRRDVELELARKLVRAVRETHGRVLPQGVRRASNWLALAGPALTRDVEKLERDAAGWLRGSFAVDWSPDTATVALPKLALKTGAVPGRVRAGEDVVIPWQIRNDSNHEVGRVSVFVRADIAGFETKEILVGKISPNATKAGQLVVPIPWGFDAGSLTLRVGLAIESWPSPDGASEFTLAIDPHPPMELTAVGEFEDAPNSKVEKTLESGETGKIKVVVTNRSEVTAHEVKVRIQNLSGLQLRMKGRTVSFAELGPGRSETFTVDVGGESSLRSGNLVIGLAVESRESSESVFAKVPIRSVSSGLAPPAIAGSARGNAVPLVRDGVERINLMPGSSPGSSSPEIDAH